ncbi:MAG: hypothetical protein JXA13_06460 [Anaerolineales bacterium]|nr:hypothetical protein [Anaerolineales bacterium]
MNKKIRILIALVLVLVVAGVSSRAAVWANVAAGESTVGGQTPDQYDSVIYDRVSSISVTESGSYTIGGICEIDIQYNDLNKELMDQIDVEVPIELSRQIPFGYEGDLYLPGCHVVHHVDGEIVREVSTEDGNWNVCFAERPDIELTVYYYYDEPDTNSQIWIELETWHEDGYACASALYTGEYAPGSDRASFDYNEPRSQRILDRNKTGTVLPPEVSTYITESGAYSAGGICTLIILYREPYQSNELHVADALMQHHDPVDAYNYSGFSHFPDGAGLLYQPGCHVLHYKFGEITHWQKKVDQGEWEICFAARPDKEMTIYYYLGDRVEQESGWRPLETTVENGMACAPAFYTGVYVPTGK